MSQSALNTGAAFDIRNLAALKLAAKRSPQQGLKAAARQFEGLFVQMMLKSMREASFKGGLFDNQQSQMYTSLYDQQLSQDMAAQGGLGFADQIVRQMGGAEPSPAPSDRQPLISPLVSAVRSPRPVAQASECEISPAYPRTTAGGLSGNDRFIARLMSPARDVARLSGIPHQLIIAQAALESGWGHREILTAQGKPSHNLFGIKATPDWKGETTDITTSEYINGSLQKVKASFRVYKNYAEALTDYATFLTANPRYQQVISSPTVEKAVNAVQAGGYATDPNYAKKLMKIVHYVQNTIARGAENYKKTLDELF
ncbi:flagellar assembly peptidoglycan hydrolase FlgJ [Pantoea anthophila]|uniref:flagellar assembly peptidoglycan hydrolase FlgJ n=1 Tax=Pantoea anthophila TaxID=470931 RepID=UPI002782EE26|nr:flagellar assembly peptidoglycan hydrolase FlgJ [Pantoea anthophila]MDQ1213488.1 flagellar protein FlgJ [Pantoea anthophila]